MRKTLIGTVVSTKMQNTIVIALERKMRHPLYRKVMSKSKRIKAHNEIEGIKEGDTVEITETRPISKHKNFQVTKKLD